MSERSAIVLNGLDRKRMNILLLMLDGRCGEIVPTDDILRELQKRTTTIAGGPRSYAFVYQAASDARKFGVDVKAVRGRGYLLDCEVVEP